ncbi:MAG: ribonuclease P protein component [Nocardioides sp.]
MPSIRRLTSGPDFSRVVRRGRRVGSRLLVVHRVVGETFATRPEGGADPVSSGEAKAVSSSGYVGLVVSRAVGSAVIRNKVKRRLRHLVRERASAFGAGTSTVVRANPGASRATYHELGDELDRCLSDLRERRRER